MNKSEYNIIGCMAGYVEYSCGAFMGDKNRN